ncbi:DUF6415 family natural product biosynthesis protein [Streptomyces aureoverticillatus]|uniref:DUF6415 family natural product biosynthesis protein n=1 Tax=Streptomyces aureoverticillatus TaxID=66871 RepID=UPI0013DC3891|nr:DUF6415 family natural product biosynthesis protein [Streptomyces aureoverticillatus]QIB42677.1 ATP-binding protein [Streptomyces aureoverticillatus]
MTEPSGPREPAPALCAEQCPREQQYPREEGRPSPSCPSDGREGQLVLCLGSAHRLTLDGAPHLAAVPEMRHTLTDALRTWGLGQMADVVVLVATELVTNALLHAAPCGDVALSHGHGLLFVEVADSSATAPVRARARSGSEERGLALVRSLSQDWGWVPRRHGKRVWALLAIRGSELVLRHMETAQRSAHQTVVDALPADRGLATTIDRVLTVWNPRRPASLPRAVDARRVSALLAGHLQLLVDDTTRRADRLPRLSAARQVAEQAVGEARRRLSWAPGPDLPAAVGHAQRLARSVRSLLLVRRTLDEALGYE